MRDFRDAKAMAQTIRAALAAKGLKITISESLELVAKALGASDWNTLAAAIKAPKDEAAAVPDTNALQQIAKAFGAADWPSLLAAIRAGTAVDRAAAAASPRPTPTGRRFGANLEATLHRSVALAKERKHQYNTLEHLLLALIDDADAAAVMEACRVDLPALAAALTRYVDEDLKMLVTNVEGVSAPTAGFHRVIQRAVIHVQSSGRDTVTGANVLVAIFSEQESRACHFLEEQKMTRWDAVNFIAHGIRKGDAAA